MTTMLTDEVLAKLTRVFCDLDREVAAATFHNALLLAYCFHEDTYGGHRCLDCGAQRNSATGEWLYPIRVEALRVLFKGLLQRDETENENVEKEKPK